MCMHNQIEMTGVFKICTNPNLLISSKIKLYTNIEDIICGLVSGKVNPACLSRL